MKLVIRKASTADLNDLAEISRNTWDGHDYLEEVSKAWLNESGFVVGEVDNRVIACAKITAMPGQVAWLEGLRVHPEFRGKGLGKLMSEKVLQLALEKVDQGEFSSIEFSTYIGNVESRAMAEKQGFQITELFHVVGIEDPAETGSSVNVTEATLTPGDLSIYREHTPCGWKYIHTSATDAISWLKKNAGIWQTESGARFLASNRGFEVSPLASALDDPEGFIAGALWLARSKSLDYLEMMVHDSHSELLNLSLKAGFSYWEEQGVANIPVYRFIKG